VAGRGISTREKLRRIVGDVTSDVGRENHYINTIYVEEIVNKIRRDHANT